MIQQATTIRIMSVLAFVAGCSGPTTKAGPDAENDAVASSMQPLMTGATSVSNVGPLQNLSYESETAVVNRMAIGTQIFAGYNAGDPDQTHVSYTDVGGGHEDRRVCSGTSLMGLSRRNSDGTWDRFRLQLPPGIALLWGDPAMTSADQFVYYSVLSSPQDRFDAAVAARGENGCLHFSDVPGSSWPNSMGVTGAIAGACVYRISGNMNFTTSCFRNGNDFYDGGTMATTNTTVYAAYFNASQGTVALHAAPRGSSTFQVSTLPAGMSAGVNRHVLLRGAGDTLFMAFATGATIWMATFSESTGVWNGPVVVAQDFNASQTTLKNGQGIRGRGFVMGEYGSLGPAQVALFYQRRVGSTTFSTLKGVTCTADLTCSAPEAWKLSNSSNNFMPSLATAWVADPGGGPSQPRNILSYWSDLNQSTGTVAMRFAQFTLTSLSAQWAGGEPVNPCPGRPDYWGDYDGTFVVDNRSAHPQVIRLLTDSTGASCDSRDYRAFPHHVSALPLIAF